MSVVKSFAVGNGDMFFIRHNSDNFTMIDCCLPENREGGTLAELSAEKKAKGIWRFISTHPDQDHIGGLAKLDDLLTVNNFYCVKNAATKAVETADFIRYRQLRDGSKSFNVYKGATRRWMNQGDENRGSSGINILWPSTSDEDFKSALVDAAIGMSPNNISPIIKYSLDGGVTMLWMGDLETDFMEKIQNKVEIPKIDVLFAPHHGRTSGKVPKEWLRRMDPQIVVIGEAPSEYLHYYSGYNIMTQNSCGDIIFDNRGGKTDIYVSEAAYSVDYLADDGLDVKEGLYYVGSLSTA